MLEISKTEEGYIKVIEKLPSWNTTTINIILYDMKNKKSKINNDPWYDMTESAINWVKKYYIPKLRQD